MQHGFHGGKHKRSIGILSPKGWETRQGIRQQVVLAGNIVKEGMKILKEQAPTENALAVKCSISQVLVIGQPNNFVRNSLRVSTMEKSSFPMVV